MKLLMFLFALALGILTTAASFPADDASSLIPALARRALKPSCVINTNGSFQRIIFDAQFENMTVTGEGRLERNEIHLSLAVYNASRHVMSHTGILSNDVYTLTWTYGKIFPDVNNMTIIINNDKTTTTTVDGVNMNTSMNVTFPHLLPQINPKLQQLSDFIKSALQECRSSMKKKRAWEDHLNGFEKRQDQFGIPGMFENTASGGSCIACLAEAYAASAACGLACGFSFGLACGCVAGIPFIFANCHSPGTGFGQGCCPVSCGPSSSILGIGVVFQCCSANDLCLNSNNGVCCPSGTQPCNGNICCPSNAPCRDPGICCPTTRNTCITPNGPTCCNEGESCVEGMCCPPSQIVNGQCCPPSSHTCCPSGSVSRCFKDGYETCINNQWVFTSCPQYSTCTGIPVANAGVYCQADIFCNPGTPSRCYKDGVQTCSAKGRWEYTPCPPTYFCTHPPVAGATNAYCQAPAPCSAGTESKCYKDGMISCVNGQWVFEQCVSPKFCQHIPVAGAGVTCIAPPL